MRTIHSITSTEKDLLDFISNYNPQELAQALRDVHDIALYNSTIAIEENEKLHLLHVKLLADELEKLETIL
jgi:hypothetical protein